MSRWLCTAPSGYCTHQGAKAFTDNKEGYRCNRDDLSTSCSLERKLPDDSWYEVDNLLESARRNIAQYQVNRKQGNPHELDYTQLEDAFQKLQDAIDLVCVRRN